ncbi:hypothetical protein ED208_10545 [Stagnimonas aquatica]|uniref:CopG family transcriptional regulator n=1 Tax=Stagnimonas aquatica TaxID=2689987 RepID=A0A3N0VA29_9GAMM|nr:hypothetical protein [Stagnimonas aquatica]ROH89559.1 hypothetical protein ED208_10545 [Stagnimonas aquatica]
MTQLLMSLPDALAARLKSAVPARQRSKFIAELLERELDKQESALYQSALAVEQDSRLREEMADWDITSPDGLDAAR